MNKYWLIAALAMALAAPTASAQTTRAQTTGPRPMPESYSVLKEKTMFSRQHVKPRPRSYAPEPPPKPRPPVLIGIIVEPTGPTAYFESPRSGVLAAYNVGDEIAGAGGGKIKDITLDYVELVAEAGAPAHRVNIGQDLSGEGVTLAAPPSASNSGSATSAPASSAPAASGGAASILERLRARRQQELGK